MTQIENRFPQEVVRLPSGAADSLIERHEDRGFELIAAAEAPDGVEDFLKGSFFLWAMRSEGAAEILAQGGVVFFFPGVGEGSGE